MTYLLTGRRPMPGWRVTRRLTIRRKTSLPVMVALMEGVETGAELPWSSADVLIADVYRAEAANLVRLARFFVDDRDAAEDLVQEAFIRFARSVGRLRDQERAPAYLRSIVLNLARDHNRRGLVSLRHQPAADLPGPSLDDLVALRADQQRVIEALRNIPRRQRDCLVLRYYLELSVSEIAKTLGVSPNSVKTHLQRGLRSLSQRLDDPE